MKVTHALEIPTKLNLFPNW